MIVGTAEVLVLPLTKGFEDELKKQTSPAFGTLRKDAEAAGEDAGIGIRSGVTRETGKLAADVEKDGEKAGEGLHRGFSGGLSKVASALSATGLPLEHFNRGLEASSEAAKEAESSHSGLTGSLEKLGGVALAGVAVAAAGVAAESIHLAEGMQSADASIAAASGTSIKAATQIGNAFLDTAGKSEFSGEEMAKAFASVAGQLKETEGHALSAAQASRFMAAADDLATAKQIDLGTAVSATAGIMQAFHLRAQDAAHVSDVLFTTSTKTGQSIDTLAMQLERVRGRLGEMAGGVGDLSTLLVDMTDRGITGRAAMGALNTAFNTLQTAATGVQKAMVDQNAALEQMPPNLRALAEEYQRGEISQKAYTAATKALSPEQAALLSNFTTATKAVETAEQKYKALGVTVFDAQGKFVGMRDIIAQLHTRLAGMTEQQQLATASLLFGSGAARQMLAVIQAGPEAYDKASAAVNQHGAAQSAAAKQAATLKVEEETLKAEMEDLGAKIGQVLIPVITSMVAWFVKATTFVTDHKAALIALAAVVTGILGPAIAVFAINKMASFVGSVQQASGHVKQFASDVEGVVSRVIAAFGKQDAATQTMAQTTEAQTANAGGAAKTMATDVEGAASTVETQNANAGGSFATLATDARTATATVEGDVATMATDVTAADTTIEGENATAAESFAGLDAAAAGGGAAGISSGIAGAASALGPLALVGAGGFLLAQSGAGGPLPNNEAPVGSVPRGSNAGGRVAGLGGGFNPNLYNQGPLQSTASQLGITLPSGSGPVNPVPQHHGGKAARLSRVHTAGDVSAHAASGLSSVDQWAALAQQAAAQYGIPADVLLADIAQESGGNPNALSSAGAFGLTQFVPGTAAEYGVMRGSSAAAVRSQIFGQAHYLANLGGRTNIRAALEGYYTGTAGSPAGAGYANSVLAQVPEYARYNVPGAGFAPASAYAGALPTSASTAVSTAQATAELNKTIAQETAAVNKEVATLQANERAKGTSPAQKAKDAADIAALKGALSIEVATQRGELSKQTAQQKAELSKQTSDLKAGTTELTKLLAAIHTGGVKTLSAALFQAHQAGLSRIERDLDHDHSAALASLSKELVAVHKQAMQDLVKAQKAAAAQAATAAAISADTQAAKVTADQAKVTADSIADATKVYLDQQAEAGKTGAALQAAQAQTYYDQVVGQWTQAVDQAQTALDQTTAGTLQNSDAQLALAQAQANATVQQANAQSVLDIANATAQAASSAASAANPTPSSTSAAAAAQPTFNFTIYGTMPAGEAMSEAAWAIRTGALPVAPPATPGKPVPAGTL